MTEGFTTALVSLAAAYLCILLNGKLPAVWIVTGAVICVSLWLMQQSIGIFNLSALSISALWYWLYLAFVLIPGLFVAGDHPEPYRTRYLVAIVSGALTVPLGVWLTCVICSFRKLEVHAYFLKPVLREKGPQRLVGAVVIFLGIALALSILYLIQVRTVPLLDLFTHPGDYNMLVAAREESLKLMNSSLVYAYAVLRSTLYPLLILVALGRYLTTRHAPWGAIFVVSLAAGLAYAALTIAKAPVTYLITSLALFFYLYRGGRMSLKATVSGLALLLAFPLFILMSEQAGSVDFWGALTNVGHRLFVLPANVLYYYFEVFPDVMPFQHGATIGKFAALLGIPFFDDANFVGRYMMSHGFGFRSTVTANAPFLGSLYTDFGFYGVVAGGFAAGVIMQSLQIHLIRRPKTMMNLAIFSFLLVTFALLNATTLPVVLLSDGGLLVFAFAAILKYLDSQLAPHRREAEVPRLRPDPWRAASRPVL